MNEMIKAQYRNGDIKDEAYEIAERVFELLPVSELLNNPDMLKVFCKTASLAIIKNSVKTFKKNIDSMLVKRGKKSDPKETENIIKEMSGLFIDEMQNSAGICMMDLNMWAAKAVTMGAGPDRIGQTLAAAWATKTPPLFADFNQRVKQAIDGYVNSVFQMLVLSNAD